MSLSFRMLAAVALVALGGCSLGGIATQEPAAPAAPTAPPVDMSGRWTFAGGGASCTMNFGAAQGAEGEIRPEGGCPGSFFTSRKWGFDGNALVMRDHTGKPLAQLQSSAPGRYEGQAAAGGPVTLTR